MHFQDLNVNSPYCLPYISNFSLEFNKFPALSRTSFQDFPDLENATVKFQDFPGFPGSVRTLLDALSHQQCTKDDVIILFQKVLFLLHSFVPEQKRHFKYMAPPRFYMVFLYVYFYQWSKFFSQKFLANIFLQKWRKSSKVAKIWPWNLCHMVLGLVWSKPFISFMLTQFCWQIKNYNNIKLMHAEHNFLIN